VHILGMKNDAGIWCVNVVCIDHRGGCIAWRVARTRHGIAMSPRTAISDVSEVSVSQLTAELALLQVKQESTSRNIMELELRLNESQGSGDTARAEIDSLRVVEEELKLEVDVGCWMMDVV